MHRDGTFKPSETVTRAQMAKMLYMMMNGGAEDATAWAGKASFTDVAADHWAAGYVTWAQSAGIIAGYGDGNFGPEAAVTGTQAAKMALGALGYTGTPAGLTGANWEAKTLELAGKNNLFKNVKSSIAEGLPRQFAAVLLNNTLWSTCVTWNSASQTFDFDKLDAQPQTMAQKYMGMSSFEGVVTGVSKGKVSVQVYGTTGELGATTAYDTTVDYSEMLGQKVSYTIQIDKTTGKSVINSVVANSNAKVVTGTVSALNKGTEAIKLSGTEYKVEVVAADKLAGATGTFDDVAKFADTEKLDDKTVNAVNPSLIKLIDNDGNGKYETYVVTPVTTAKVTFVNDDEVSTDGDINFKKANADYKVADGVEIAMGDYICAKADAFNGVTLIGKAEKLEDTLTKTTAQTGYTQCTIADVVYNAEKLGDGVEAGKKVTAWALNSVLLNVKSAEVAATMPKVGVVAARGMDGYDYKVKLTLLDGTSVEGLATAEPEVGQTVSYTMKDGKYELTEIKDGAKLVDGDFTLATTQEPNGKTEAEATENDTSKNGTETVAVDGDNGAKIANVKVADVTNPADVKWTDTKDIKFAEDAKVLVKGKETGEEGKTKLITTKQLKEALDGTPTVTNSTCVAYFTATGDSKKDAENYCEIKFAVVTAAGKLEAVAGSSYANYGYVVSAASSLGNDTYEYDVWTGTDKVTVQDKNSASKNFKAGVLIGYEKIGDDKVIVSSTKIEKDDKFSDTKQYTAVAVTSPAGDNKSFVANGKKVTITDKTVVLNVKGTTGTPGTALQAAKKAKTGTAVNNAFVVPTKDASKLDTVEAALVIVNITGDAMEGEDTVAKLDQAAAAAAAIAKATKKLTDVTPKDVASAFAEDGIKYVEVTTLDLKATDNATDGTVDLAADKTLSIDGTDDEKSAKAKLTVNMNGGKLTLKTAAAAFSERIEVKGATGTVVLDLGGTKTTYNTPTEYMDAKQTRKRNQTAVDNLATALTAVYDSSGTVITAKSGTLDVTLAKSVPWTVDEAGMLNVTDNALVISRTDVTGTAEIKNKTTTTPKLGLTFTDASTLQENDTVKAKVLIVKGDEGPTQVTKEVEVTVTLKN